MHPIAAVDALFYFSLFAIVIAGLKLDDELMARKFARQLALSRAARRR